MQIDNIETKETSDLNARMMTDCLIAAITPTKYEEMMTANCGAYATLREYKTNGLILRRQIGKTTFCRRAMPRLREMGYNVHYFSVNRSSWSVFVDELSLAEQTTKSHWIPFVHCASDLDGIAKLGGKKWDEDFPGNDIIIILDEVSPHRFHQYAKDKLNPKIIERMRIFFVGTVFY